MVNVKAYRASTGTPYDSADLKAVLLMLSDIKLIQGCFMPLPKAPKKLNRIETMKLMLEQSGALSKPSEVCITLFEKMLKKFVDEAASAASQVCLAHAHWIIV